MGTTAAFMSAYGKVRGGDTEKVSADAAATQLNQEAGQSVASGIQGAINERKRATYIASSAQARAAASGGSASDPTVVNDIADIQGEGEYRALTALYQGNDRAQELRQRASTLRRQGSAAQKSGWLSGISSVLTGSDGSFFDKYNGGANPSDWSMSA